MTFAPTPESGTISGYVPSRHSDTAIRHSVRQLKPEP